MKDLPKVWSDLSRFLSVATEGQLLTAYFGGNRAALERAVRRAKARGLIEVRVEMVRLRDTQAPIAVLRPGEAPPRSEQVAYLASQRWHDSLVPTVVIQASAKLAALAGGTSSLVASGHVSHEVAVTEIFLKKREADSAFSWSLISQCGPRGGRVDAVAGSGGLLVELVGRYSGGKVALKMELAGTGILEFW